MKSLRKHLFFVTVLAALLTPIFCGAQPDASPRNVISRIDNIAEKNITTDDALNARATANTAKSRTSNSTRANANRGRESSRTTNARKTNERNTTNRGNARNSGREVANAGRATQSRTARTTANTRTKAVTARSSSTQSRAATASRVARSATNAKTVARTGTTNNAATRSAIPGRVATNASRAAASTTAKRARNTTATALTSGGAITLMEQCKTQYTQCMDNFCDVLDDAQGRCSCSKNIKNYSKTTAAQKEANQALQDIAQQIQYIGLTKDEVETLFAQTEAELTMQGASDNSQIKNSLDKIKDMIVEVKPANASNTDTDTGMSFNLDGLLDFSFNSTSIDLMELFGGNQSNTATISNQRGEQLYKTASARCKKTVLETCEAQGVNVSLITNSYDMEIDRACIAYERSLTEGNDNIEQTVRNAQSVLQRARLMVAQQKNAYDLRGCISALDSCMQDDYVCGSDYELCLDPTGKYIVDGEVVVGSTPGYILDGADNMSPAAMYSADTLMSAWYYDDGKMFAWGNDNTEGTLADYINDSVGSAVTKLDSDSNMAEYLQYKIGYNDSGKNYGMCMSVLNKCQDITYDNGKYIPDNQVIKEYLSRTLVQIKAAQDEILADYAESCITDVSSCLSSNNFDLDASDSRQNIAINACRSQIKTCMSVNGNTAIAPSPESIKNWIIAMMGGEVAPETPDDGGDDTPGTGGDAGGDDTPGTGGDDTPGTGGDDTPEKPTIENPYIDNNPETTMTVKNTIVDEDTNTTVLLVEDTDTDACYATVPQADGSYDPTELGACIVDCETGTTSSDVCDDENIVTLVNGTAGGATTYSLRGGTSGAPTLMFDGKAVNELKLALNNGELPTDITWIKNLAQGTDYTFEGIADANGNEYYNRLGVRQKATATPGIELSVMFEYDAVKAACNGTWDEENQSCNCSALAGAIYDEDSASCICNTNAGFAAGVPTAVAGCACESGTTWDAETNSCKQSQDSGETYPDCDLNVAMEEECDCKGSVATITTTDGTGPYCLDDAHMNVFAKCEGEYDVANNTCNQTVENQTCANSGGTFDKSVTPNCDCNIKNRPGVKYDSYAKACVCDTENGFAQTNTGDNPECGCQDPNHVKIYRDKAWYCVQLDRPENSGSMVVKGAVVTATTSRVYLMTQDTETGACYTTGAVYDPKGNDTNGSYIENGVRHMKLSYPTTVSTDTDGQRYVGADNIGCFDAGWLPIADDEWNVVNWTGDIPPISQETKVFIGLYQKNEDGSYSKRNDPNGPTLTYNGQVVDYIRIANNPSEMHWASQIPMRQDKPYLYTGIVGLSNTPDVNDGYVSGSGTWHYNSMWAKNSAPLKGNTEEVMLQLLYQDNYVRCHASGGQVCLEHEYTSTGFQCDFPEIGHIDPPYLSFENQTCVCETDNGLVGNSTTWECGAATPGQSGSTMYCTPNAEIRDCTCDSTVGTEETVDGTNYCLDGAHKTVFDGCTGTYNVETNTCTQPSPNSCAANAVVDNCTCDSTVGTKMMVNSIYYCLNAETLASFESCRKDKGRYVVETGMCYGSAPQCEATGGTWTYDPNTCECPAGTVYQPSSTKCISLIEDFCAKNYKTLDDVLRENDVKGYKLRSSYSTYPGAEYIGTVSLGDTATPQSGDECGYVFRDKAEWYHGNVCYLASGGHVVSLVDCELAESGHIRNAVWVEIDGLREETSRVPTFEIARQHPLEFYIVGSGTDGKFPSLTEHANYKIAFSQDDGFAESTYTDDEFKLLGVFRYPGGKGVQLYDENGEQTEYMANFHRQHDAYLDATDGTALHVYWEDVQNPASRDLTHLQDMTMCNAYHETYCPCYDSKMLLIDSECNVVYTRYGMYTGGDEGLAMCAAQNSGQIEEKTLENDISTEGYNGWTDVQTITTADSADSFAYPWQCGMSVREAYEDDLSQCFVFRGAAARSYTTRVPTLDSQGMAKLLAYGGPVLVDPGYCNASSPVKSIPVNKTITVDIGDARSMYIGGRERYTISVAIPDQAGKTPPSLTPFINRSKKESSGQVFYGVFENEDFSGVQYYDATGNWIDNAQTRAKVAALGPEGKLTGYMWWTHVNDQLTFLKPVASQAECLSKNGTYQSPNRCYCDGAKFLKADKNQETCVCYDTTNSGLSDMTFDTQTRACTCKGALNVVHTLEPVYYCGIPTNKGFRAQDDASTGQSAKQQCEAGHGTYYEAPPYPWDNCLCKDGYATYDNDATTCVEEIDYEALCTDDGGIWHGDRCTCPAEGYAWNSTLNKCVTHDRHTKANGCVTSGGTWYEYKEAPNTPDGQLPHLEHCDCLNNTVNPDATWWYENGRKCVPYDLKISSCKVVWGGEISYNEVLGKDVCTCEDAGAHTTQWILGTTMYYQYPGIDSSAFTEECNSRFGHYFMDSSGNQYAGVCVCSADVPNATGELDAEGKCGCQEGYTRVWISEDRKMKCIK